MTLNQIVQSLKRTASRHKQLNTFYYGDPSEWHEFTGLVYPSCLIALDKATIADRETAYSFQIWIADLLNEDGNNRTDAHSDMLQILGDYLAAIDDPSIASGEMILEHSGNSITFFDDVRGGEGQNPDRVGGVRSGFSIRVPFLRDRCAIPERKAIITEQGFTLFTEDNKSIQQEDQRPR